MSYSQAKRLIKMSPREQDKLYRHLYRHVTKVLSGGGCYGFDWHTVGYQMPQIKTYLWTIKKLRVRSNKRKHQKHLLAISRNN